MVFGASLRSVCSKFGAGTLTELQMVGSVVAHHDVTVVTLKTAYPRTSRGGVDVSSERGPVADDIQPHVGIAQRGSL
jgi:hypothetical protein